MNPTSHPGIAALDFQLRAVPQEAQKSTRTCQNGGEMAVKWFNY